MKEKTKVYLACGGLLIVCGLLVTGIGKVLYKEPAPPNVETQAQESMSEEVLAQIDYDADDALKDEKNEGLVGGGESAEENVKISLQDGGKLTVSDVLPKEEEQKIQENPVIPDIPTQAPELKEGENIYDNKKVPEYVERTPDPKPTEAPVVTVPASNAGHEGEIYLEGFGWIKDSGKPNVTIYAPEMYLSGEKVGDM